MTITRLLVANRGEIARRVFRTARSLGIQTVAVHSDPDRDAPFVAEADLAVALPGTTSAETYLDAAAVIAAATRAGADAVHPGYGFLSENPDFAEAVEAAGLTWVGPPPTAIRAMALKVEAKRLAAKAGVPLVPGAELSAAADADELRSAGDGVGYPLLVKASAGGGGKGMRVVERAEDLADAVAAAQREAASAFGDPTVFLERYVTRARHVEVQVFGDAHGGAVHLFERECSIQRRHQKIVEESPSPGATDATREAMFEAAVALTREIGYVGAGTVEFIVSGEGSDQEFYFLEMNTRLQVEHPVTEAVTGLDLVEWQLRIAQGEPIPLLQSEIRRHGHAVEVRLYAEDPTRGYLPNTGRLHVVDTVGEPNVRVDSGVESGSEVSAHYDPMLAKVIAHGPTRAVASARLAGHLRRMRIHGLTTNRDSLVAVLDSPAYRAGDTTTAFLEEHPEVLAPALPEEVRDRHLVAATFAESALQRAAAPDRDLAPAGWRNVPATLQARSWHPASGGSGEEDVTVAYRTAGAVTADPAPRVSLVGGDQDPFTDPGRTVPDPTVLVRSIGRDAADAADVVVLDVDTDGVGARVTVTRYADLVCVDDGLHSTAWRPRSRFGDATHEAGARGPSTPVPGTVTLVQVAVGDRVREGQTLVVLEAMKMEHRIVADSDAVVTDVLVEPGQAVDAHQVVVVLDETDETVTGTDDGASA
ncbi:MAG: biotin carboxylase N-terminal domain-containing protein [Candidatus Nanopelagicales bacterium]